MAKWLLILFVVCCLPVAQAAPKEFWLWPKVPVNQYDHDDNTLYILRGQMILYRGKEVFDQQGQNFANLKANVVLVYRLPHLVSSDFVARILKQDIASWQRHNVKVVGVQLDYDSPSLKLPRYQKFIAALQNELGDRVPVSITGLVDWLRSSPAHELRALQRQVQFIAFQLYTHGKVYPDIVGRVADLKKLTLPYKVGVLDARSASLVQAELPARLFNGSIQFQETPR